MSHGIEYENDLFANFNRAKQGYFSHAKRGIKLGILSIDHVIAQHREFLQSLDMPREQIDVLLAYYVSALSVDDKEKL